MDARRFVFHPPGGVTVHPNAATHLIYSDEPALALEEALDEQRLHRRHDAQLAGLPEKDLADTPGGEHSLFGNDLNDFCRKYVVRRIGAVHKRAGEHDKGRLPPVGHMPPQIVRERSNVSEQFEELVKSPVRAPDSDAEVLYLFHVIVALEWVPTEERMLRLKWAFRRASDYLYDVSNGTMAFGQVTFAGPSWLAGADIQLLASNRFLPRSWVSGLLERHKYTPIRLGRGLWIRDRRIVVDWDEPEGYRAIVHEWAHYALGLKDAYMAVRLLHSDPTKKQLFAAPRDGATEQLAVVMPNRRVKSESIMASVQGNSELASPIVESSDDPSNLSRVLGERYPGLGARLNEHWSGPGMLPLPLPSFRMAGELARGIEATERKIAIPKSPTTDTEAPAVVLDDDGIPTGRWELFITRLTENHPSQLIFQGEFDARAPDEGFTLLGAATGDTLLLTSNVRPFRVWARKLGTEEEERNSFVQTWWRRLEGDSLLAATQNTFGSVSERQGHLPSTQMTPPKEYGPQATPPNVLPITPMNAAEAAQTKAKAVVALDSDSTPALTHSVFGIGVSNHERASEVEWTYSLPSLDGYVITTSDRPTIEGMPSLTISDFSQGGPPGTAPSIVSDPISAGAANGEALILCDVREHTPGVDRYRVITTTLRGAPLPVDYKLLSPVYSVATNLPLLESFTPTLLIVNSFSDGEPLDDARVCRVEDKTLIPLPTHIAAGGAYAVAPLRHRDSALVTEAETVADTGRTIVERFVLAHVPVKAEATAATTD